MKRGQKRALSVLGIIVGIVVVASVALRLILTKERLTAMLVPRIERAVGAEIEVGDIAIRFPFGFGVVMRDLTFARQTPEGGRIVFAADDLGVDVSLMSLIRRRPEIQSVRAGGASLEIDPGRGKPVITLEEVEARLSMKPADTLYVLDPRLTAGAVTLKTAEGGAAVRLPAMSFSGTVEATSDFQRLAVRGGELSVAGLAALGIEASVEDLKGSRDFTAKIGARGLDASGLVDAMLSLDLSGLKPGMTPEKMRALVPVAVEAGTVDLDVTASGSGTAPARALVDGTLRLDAVALRSPAIGLPLRASGPVRFSMNGAASEGITIEAGRSRIELSFDVPLEGQPKKPGAVGFAARANIDIGEAAAAADPSKPAPTGTLEAEIRGSGRPQTLAALFPPASAPADPAAIRKAWGDIRLEGTVKVSGLEPPATDQPVRLSRIAASAKIAGGDVNGVDATFRLGGSPWKVTGDLRGIMPAFAELSHIGQGDAQPKTPGEALDKLTCSPDVSLAVTGRSFNAIPFQEAAAKREKGPASGPARGAPAAGSPTANPLAENPVTLLLLKKTSVSVRVDSVVARGAVLTDVDAKGRLSDGRLRADPVTLRYAGGTGRGMVKADLRDPHRIPSEIDLDFTGVQAGQALSGLHSAGGLVSGEFSFSLGGKFESGPGVDLLRTITAAGNASSTKGQVDLSRFMQPLKATGVTLPFAEQFSFHEWTEKFTVEAGRVATDLWQIRSASGDWDIAGSFGFDGTIDYRAKLLLTPAMQKQMKDLDKYRDLVDLFRDDTGNVVLEFDVGGTAKSPKMQLDQTKARQKAGEKLIEGAQKKLLDLLKKK